ncbi:DUF4430 domain-containing protein [Aminipila butyrica]|uniref:DUF4430 domain-containing protein n=1 Tax=Aminipila butyrica TaxID=433296 RepID=A0A858BVG7_9FIRM|nr:immunoglobulin-like domain-containing protein [Aminipila butyrica]QIB70051.1 DUF4430 domain-containing protein [Aminipila butyrica]
MKNKQTQKKILAIILSGIMCLNLFPTLALADTAETVEPPVLVQEENSLKAKDSLESERFTPEERVPSEALEGETVPELSPELSEEEASKFPEDRNQEEDVDETSILTAQPEGVTVEEKLALAGQQAGTVWDGQTVTKPQVDENEIYQIANGENLAWFAKLVNGTLSDGTAQNKGAKAVLVNDIVLGSDTIQTNWTPVGNSSNQYTGTFDGAGYTICDLRIEATAIYQGLFGYVGSTGVVRNTTVEGNISAKANYAGGIAGYNAGTIENCCNKAAITSTQKYVGGITGSNYGATSYANLIGCYNEGVISAKSDTGGIAGQNRNANISSCYNLAKVESAGSNTGGVVGYGYTGSITSCYNVGAVTSTGTSNVGAVVGFLFKSATAILEKTYYLDGTYTVSIGNDSTNANATVKSADAMKTAGFVADLGGNFVADTMPNQNNGYPIIGWQDPQAKYTVAFDIDQEQAEIAVRDSEGRLIIAEGEGLYKLGKGTYSYTVSKDEYKTVEDSFSINNGGKKITVNLEIKTYDVTFGEISPVSANILVKDAQGTVCPGDGWVYHLPKGSYTYTIDKFGFQTAVGSFTVTGVNATIPKIVLAESARSPVTFEISFIDNNPSAVSSITVKYGEEVQEKSQDGSYRLADGEYTYAITCHGYKTIMGTITVAGQGIHIPKTMDIRTVWSGAAEEPSTLLKDGKTYYQIENGENLAWFANYVNSGKVTANAVVTGNILLSNEQQDNTWISIGAYNKAYAGTFDGQGFKITGLKGSNGLFAYSDVDSVIKNVIVEGIIAPASSNVGGIMGVNSGMISNCSFRGSIVSTGQRVGGITGNNAGGTVENCVNYASTKVSTASFATDLYAGGVAGQSSGTLKNCYNAGAISGACPASGYGEIGGITGKSTGSMQNCYNVGVITKETATMGKVGAVAGSSSGTSSNCYYLADSFGTGLGSGTGDVTAKTETEIKDETFVTILGEAFNQDNSGAQAINEGYPVLKWQGGLEVGGNANVEAVAADRTALQLASLIIKEAGNLTLPVVGEHGTTISWVSSNTDIITDTGLVQLPSSGNVQVILTATIRKGTVSDTKQFAVTVKSLDEATMDYLTAANNALGKLLLPAFGADTNVVDLVEEKLHTLGFSDITVTLINNVDETYIAPNGDITYFYVDPNLNNVMNFAQVKELKFALSKAHQHVDYTVNANIRWDGSRVLQAINEQIAANLTFEKIRGANTDSHGVTENLNLPQQLSGKAWATISWQSSSTYINPVKKDSVLFGDLTGEVTRPQNDTEVTLIATITFNKTGSSNEETPITVEKIFNIVLKGDNIDWPSYMQSQLNEKYTLDKLKISSSGKPIDSENITEDIQLLVGKNTGIDKYFDYKFTVSSSDPETIAINGYRAAVYRPLPEETAKKVILTVFMQRNNTDIIVSKDLTVKVQPLVQTEIDQEIALMERVKASYAEGILDGADGSQVTKNLHAFKECYLDAENNLVWVYDYSQRKDTGIEAYGLPKTGYDESYNLFHSSEPTILQHENLVLASVPQYDTEIIITSNLRSAQFAKYAEKYPTNESFKKLVNQLVAATVIVKGSDGSVDPNPEPPEVEVSASIKAQADGSFLVAPQTVTVAYDLAENYGYTDLVKNHVSALDALVKAHELRFGEAFTKETKNKYLQVGSNGFVSLLFERKTSNNGFAVNGKTPNDGIYNELNGGYTGYNLNQATLKNNDLIDFFIYGDTTNYSDLYTWFEEGQEIQATANVPFDVSLKGFSIARDGMKDDGEIKKNTKNMVGAQLALVDENGVIVPMQQAVTDANGQARLTLAPGTYVMTATRSSSTPILLPLSKIVVVSGGTLQEKKTAAVQELTAYKSSMDYREAQKQELENAIAKGTEIINQAETFDLVKTALSEAKKKIDTIKTNAQLTIEERIVQEQAAYDVIYTSLKAYKGGAPTEIIVAVPYSGTQDAIQKNLVNLYLNVLFEHPELFYVRTEYNIEFEGKTAIITPSILEDFNSKEALTAAINQFQEVFNSAIEKCISAEMTDLEKLLSLHDWLVNHCQYNQAGHLNGKADTMNAYTAYGALVEGDAVCQGYSMALNLLLQKAGVSSHYVSGQDHSWNVVKIAGSWYHVDSTWADDTPDRPGAVKHDYFLLSDEQIKDQTHHSQWSTRYDIKCVEPYAGDTPWKTSTVPFVYDAEAKAFFNVENQSSTTRYRKIYFDGAGNTQVQTLQNISLKNIRAQIEYKGILYLVDNTGDVYAYDLKNKVKKLISDEMIGIDPGYGLLIRGEKLIVRANYKDEQELALYQAEPISTEINKPSKIAAFSPAPGQFINKTEMLYNAYPNPEVTLENPLSEKVVSLGAYGGYIVYEFDKPITNHPNNPYGVDFIVYGNAGNGESEPGAVMVSNDGENWYELAGSEYYNADTKKNLEITYTNPDSSFKGAADVSWVTSDKKPGYIYKNNAHTQAYYPNPKIYSAYNQGVAANLKYSDTTLSFTGNKINAETVPAFGYADCHKTGSNSIAINPYAYNMERYNGDGMDLDWAVDQDGNPVQVDNIKYVKIYTAVLENHGIMGESSTEVAGILAAQSKADAVGVTADLKSLIINGKQIGLINGKYDYVYNAAEAKSLIITATGESTDNIFINNKRVSSGATSEPLALSYKVRILVQNGEKEPTVYVINVTGVTIEDNAEAQLTTYLSDLIVTALPNKSIYKIGEELDLTGLTIKGKYISNGAVVLKEIDTARCTVDGFDSQKTGAQSVQVSYYEDYYDVNQNFIKRIYATAVFVVNVSEGSTETPEVKEQSVILTIRGANNKLWISDSYVINPSVTSVMDALKAVLALHGTTYTIKAGDKYISSINGLGEFDLGKNSGWMVKVNNDLIDISAADWKLNGGEKILWFYTPDWTKVPETRGWKTEEVIQAVEPSSEQLKTVTATVTAEAKTDGQGTAKAAISTETINAAIAQVLKESELVEKQGFVTNKEIVLDVRSDSATSRIEAAMAKEAIAELNNKVDTLKLSTVMGEISFDHNAVKAMAKEATELKVTITQKDVQTTLANVQKLSDEEEKRMEKSKIFEIAVTAGTKVLSQVGGNVVIKMPYEKLANQKSEGIVAYELNSDGVMKPVLNGKMEKDQKMFKITTDHWSTYVITYQEVNFADTQNHWADSNITYLAAREVIKGMSESTFEPNSSITRAQFIQILANLSGEDVTRYDVSPFNDVKKDAWFAKSAAWAAEKGLTTGTVSDNGDVAFNPNDNITRQDMAVILSRYMSKIAQKQLREVNAEIVFTDRDQVDSYALSPVKELQRAGVINGKTADGFAPKGNATRAECSKMISVLMQDYL